MQGAVHTRPCVHLSMCDTGCSCTGCREYHPAPPASPLAPLFSSSHPFTVPARPKIVTRELRPDPQAVIHPIMRLRQAPREWSGRNFRRARG